MKKVLEIIVNVNELDRFKGGTIVYSDDIEEVFEGAALAMAGIIKDISEDDTCGMDKKSLVDLLVMVINNELDIK